MGGFKGARTIRCVSLESSMTLSAVRLRVVRPSVSINVLWSDVELATRGMGVEKWTFLLAGSVQAIVQLWLASYARMGSYEGK